MLIRNIRTSYNTRKLRENRKNKKKNKTKKLKINNAHSNPIQFKFSLCVEYLICFENTQLVDHSYSR